jgi:hypothetical protein
MRGRLLPLVAAWFFLAHLRQSLAWPNDPSAECNARQTLKLRSHRRQEAREALILRSVAQHPAHLIKAFVW